MDESRIPIVYFETPKGQISFHIPNYGDFDFNKYDSVNELKKFLPEKIIKNAKLVDNYKWSGLYNSEEIINTLDHSDFRKGNPPTESFKKKI